MSMFRISHIERHKTEPRKVVKKKSWLEKEHEENVAMMNEIRKRAAEYENNPNEPRETIELFGFTFYKD